VHGVIYKDSSPGRFFPASRNLYREIMTRLVDRGAEAIVRGCTEIMMLVQPGDSSVPLFDTTTPEASSTSPTIRDAI